MTTKNLSNHATSAPIYITQSDLPLSCPRPQDTLWSEHPRVYLPIDRESTHGEVTCPYCGRHYVLKT